MKTSDIADIRVLRDEACKALMRAAPINNDRQLRQHYLDMVMLTADNLLSFLSHPTERPELIAAAKAAYISLYALYSNLTEDEVQKRFGEDIAAMIKQVGSFENEIKLGRSGEAVKPFLPGVHEFLACEMIAAAESYRLIMDKGAQIGADCDPEILRHYIATGLAGCRSLDAENLHPVLRLRLKEAGEALAAMAEKLGGPAFIDGAHLTDRGEVRKPNGPQ